MHKKLFICLLLTLATPYAIAAEAPTAIKLFDAKIYSLKNKGVKDLVVDIVSTKLNQQINSQGTFGNVKNLSFRVFWTLAPERLEIEVLGLPEGFKEFKEELKLSVLGIVEDILPPPTDKKFATYKFSQLQNNQFKAQDSSGVADIPTFLLKFDAQNRLVEIVGQKPVGSFTVTPVYEKESFSDGRWVLKKQITRVEENGQDVTTVKTLNYGSHNGMTVLKGLTISTDQKFSRPDVKPVSFSETIEFKNYQLNAGEAMKHFMKDVPVP
jgi:hypothetical protein